MFGLDKMSISNMIAICAVCFAGVLLGGCHTVSVVDPRVNLSRTMAKMISVEHIAYHINQGGLVEAHITIRNKTGNLRQFDYRVEWTADDGSSVPSIADKWMPFSLAGFDSRSIRTTAPSPTATLPRVMIRARGHRQIGAEIWANAL